MPRCTLESNKFAFLLTTYNRCSQTLHCLSSIHSQVPNFLAVVADDASVDGTPEYVREYFPCIRVIELDGDSYWAAGMKRAQDDALRHFPNLEALFFLNDDVILESDTVDRMLNLSEQYPNSVIVGTLIDPSTGTVTYGGLKKIGFHPLAFELIEVVSVPTEVDVFHGNIFLVPKSVLLEVGGIDGSFQHAYADFDLALRFRKNRTRAILLPGIAGFCSANLNHSTSRTSIHRFRFMISPKGRPIKSQFIYMKRHGPRFVWLLFVISPYLRFFTEELGHAFGLRRRKN